MSKVSDELVRFKRNRESGQTKKREPVTRNNREKMEIAKTNIYKGRDGWEAESMSKTDANGQAWQISTHKAKGGVRCSAVQGQDEGGMFSFMMFGSKKLELCFVTGVCNEKKVREVHETGLTRFQHEMSKQKAENSKPLYVLGIGQIVFTENHGKCRERVICEVIRPGKFKSVLLDASGFEHDDHLRPFSEKFGIGAYYNEGETMDAEKVAELVIMAQRNTEIKAAEDAIKAEEARVKAEEKKTFLSQFIQADRRKTTAIIKAHILKTWPTVSKVEVKTDVFSGGDSMDVSYSAPEEIKDLEAFINSFREGRFDGMNDIYEYNEDKSEIILDGHILQTYKYTHCKFNECADIREAVETAAPVEVPADEVQVIEYSEKAIAVIGNTYPIREKLKSAGGRFNKFLTCGAGWIFPKTKLNDLQTLLAA